MRVVALTPEYEIQGFDCGDCDLNEFLLQDAKHFSEKRIANTFVLEDEGKIGQSATSTKIQVLQLYLKFSGCVAKSGSSIPGE